MGVGHKWLTTKTDAASTGTKRALLQARAMLPRARPCTCTVSVYVSARLSFPWLPLPLVPSLLLSPIISSCPSVYIASCLPTSQTACPLACLLACMCTRCPYPLRSIQYRHVQLLFAPCKRQSVCGPALLGQHVSRVHGVQHVGIHIWNSATPIQIHYINMVLPVANLGGANFSTPAAPKQLLERGRPWPG